MRLLAKCGACARQYDASGHRIGDRFHCLCGEVVEVPAPRRAELEILRCSSCGAPRQGTEPACCYCAADYSLREVGMNTVCPSCFARVDDRARYCHRCGDGVAPDLDAGHEGDIACPACSEETRLTSRRLDAGQVTILECPRCTGFWLGHDTFEELVTRARSQALPADNAPPPLPSMATQANPGRLYRPCITCSKLMNRQNFGRRSGVILDVCRGHGVWFDADELERIVGWIRTGGLGRAEQKEREALEAQRRSLERAESPSPAGQLGGLLGTRVASRSGLGFISVLFDL